MWLQTCYHQAGGPEAGETGALGPISELQGNCPAVECWWCACITINNLLQNKGNGLRQPHTRVNSLMNFKQCKKRLTWATEKRYWTVGQWSRVIFSDGSKFCISFGNRGPRVWRKPYEADKPGCTKFSIKFPQSTIVWGHHREECQQLELDLCVFCEQMSLKHFLLLTAEQLFRGDKFTLQHDLAQHFLVQRVCVCVCVKMSF